MTNFAKQYAAAKKAKKVAVITPQLFKFDKKGQKLIGVFVSKSHVPTEAGGAGYNQYVFETDEGLVKCGPGQSFDADCGEVLAGGVLYAIEFLGQAKTNKGYTVNKYNVEEVGRPVFEETPEAEPAESGQALDQE